jgi:hypothetical protein
MNLPVSHLLCLGLLTISLVSSRQAYATLGGSADSVAKDRKALSAKQRSTTTGTRYTVQEVETNATTVREYINLSGIVFGIAWNGRVHPDLTQLLGSYAGEFRSAKRNLPRKHGERRLRVKSERVVVETWGHMQSLQGRAYLPALIPNGVTANEIK